MHESSTGYSQLVLCLSNHCKNSQGIDGISADAFDSAMRDFEFLIGKYDLDPNRCLDILLDAFVVNVAHFDFFVKAIRRLNYKTAVILLRLQSKIKLISNFKFFLVLALLIKQEILMFEDVLRLILGDNLSENENLGYLAFLVEALVSVGLLKYALLLLKSYPKVLEFPNNKIPNLICNILQIQSDIIYMSKVRNTPSSHSLRNLSLFCTKVDFLNINLFEKDAFDMLFNNFSQWNISKLLNEDAIFFVKFIRICVFLMREQRETFYDIILTIIIESFLPSLSKIFGNPSVASELWCLISLFSHEIR